MRKIFCDICKEEIEFEGELYRFCFNFSNYRDIELCEKCDKKAQEIGNKLQEEFKEELSALKNKYDDKFKKELLK